MPTVTAAILAATALTAGTQAVISNQNRIAGEKAQDKVKDAQDKVLADQKAAKDQADAQAVSAAARMAARRKQRQEAGSMQGRAGTILTSQTGVPGSAQGATKQLLGV